MAEGLVSDGVIASSEAQRAAFFLQRLAPVWPSYHLNQLALAAVGFPMPSALPHVLVLAAFTIGFLLLAVRRLRRYG